jgi:solute carrier family 25 (mitochondrial carnitine/acylcarnitine transporter), member 20/29
VGPAVAGIGAGLAGTVIGFPLDVLKTRMQITHVGMLGAGKAVFREQGLLGFYRGVAAPLTALTVLNALNFSSYNFMKGELGSRLAAYDVNDKLLAVLAGASGGTLAGIISTPFEFLKTQMQINSHKAGAPVKYCNTLHALRVIVAEHGPRTLYVGHVVNTVREVIFLGTYFGVYESIKASRTLIDMVPHPNVLIPIAGGIAGSVGWFVSFPLDCIKSNIQGRWVVGVSSGGGGGGSGGLWAVGAELFRTRGLAGLYSGVSPSLMRAFVVSSTRFGVYEYVMALFVEDGS